MTEGRRHTMLPRLVSLFGGVVFVGSLGYFLYCYLWAFDTPPALAPMPAILIDLALFSAFAMHHSLFARLGVKRWIAQTVPPNFERSTYVWISSVLFIAICAWWQPVAGTLWRLEGPVAIVLTAIQLAASAFTVVAARRLDVWQLSGIRQVWQDPAAAARRPLVSLDRTGPYAIVRHPIYLGWFWMVWPAPVMNGTRLTFAIVSCLYLALAVPFEERDLTRVFGPAYGDYQREVRWRILPFVY
jgi:protein-S-isoprenylcysteine O-methyltransferase Ste14